MCICITESPCCIPETLKKKNPCNAGSMGSIPGQVIKILKFYGATKPVHHSERSCMTQVLQERLFIVI